MPVPINEPPRLAGIDRSGEPHQVAEGKWWDALNFRFTEGQAVQMQRKVQFGRVSVPYRFAVTAIVTIPTGVRNRVFPVCFAGLKVYRALHDGTFTPLDGANAFVRGHVDHRWATVVHGRKIYFTNPANKVAWTDGRTVKQATSSFVPKARYITMFYDHLFVANVEQNGGHFPSRLAWSDLYNIDRWEPKKGNEADYYDCEETATLSEEVVGITGLARMSTSLMTYTPSVIFETKYVGLPRICVTEPRFPGVGCDFYYGVASVESLHFFVSRRDREFYALSMAGGLKPIGRPINKLFFADLNDDFEAQQATWSFIHEEYKEVWWVYISKDSSLANGYDRAVIYNYAEDTWTRASVEDVHCFCRGGLIPSAVSQLAGSVGALTAGRVDRLGSTTSVRNIWGGSGGRVLRDELPTDADSALLHTEVPYLETGDRFHGDLEAVKESITMQIDAEASGGLNLHYSARPLLSSPVVWTKGSQAWTLETKEQRLSLPRVAGKVLRYKFQPQTGQYSGYVRPKRLFAEMGTKVMPQEFFEVIGTTQKAGRFTFPMSGFYTFVLIGAGGGGGGLSITPLTQVNLATIAGLTRVTLQGLKYVTSYRGYEDVTSVEAYDSVNSGLQPVKVMSTTLTYAQQTVLSQLIKEKVKSVCSISPGRLLIGYISTNLSSVGGGFGDCLVLQEDGSLIPGRLDVGGGYSVTVEYAYNWQMSFPFQESGGGSGGFLMLTVQASEGDFVDYIVGGPTPHSVVGPGNTNGGRGSDTVVTVSTTKYARAGGGIGSLNGFAGTGGVNTVVNMTAVVNEAGEAGVKHDYPMSVGQGGRGFSTDMKELFRTGRSLAPSRGAAYGAGGCGQREATVLAGMDTAGGPGYLGVFWRHEYPYDDAYTVCTPLESSGPRLKMLDLVTDAIDPQVGDLIVSVSARVRIHEYLATRPLPGVGENPSTPYTYNAANLHVGNRRYRIGVADVPGTPSWPVLWLNVNGSFQVNPEANGNLQLSIGSVAGLPIRTEPPSFKDGVAEVVDCSAYSDVYRPVYALVEVEPATWTTHNVRNVRFRHFIENVYPQPGTAHPSTPER